ncbi:SLC13 family permease [Butyricicoccus pullicaecorum]|uniref:SLC13 family permease n=1 Tax=Butyricicoccus pullicaecorum TaxID=501571 RepID=UPI0035228D59
MSPNEIISIVIFLLVMVAIVSEKVHRAAASLAGAVILLATHVLTVDSAIEHVDVNTVGVLVGMMLFVAVVKNSGLFEYIAIKSAKLTHGKPWAIMAVFAIITAVLSAFLDNVTTVLLVGPMTLAITSILKVNPVPFLLTQILASNMGGTATLIGDPPNIMIGSEAGLGFADFILNTAPIVVIIMAVSLLCFYLMFGRKLKVSNDAMQAVMELDENRAIKDKSLLIKSVVMIGLVVIGFMFHSSLGMESCTIALLAAVIMMIVGKQDIEDVIMGVEWSTILFFIGLFVVVGGMEETGVIDQLATLLIGMTGGNMVLTMLIILWVSAIVSSFLDNIPFVATLIPMILAIQAESGMDVTPLWWALSLGACLGGNGTLIGASANVVLSGISNKNGYPITFMSYLKVGFPMMILSVAISMVYLLLRFA